MEGVLTGGDRHLPIVAFSKTKPRMYVTRGQKRSIARLED